MSFKYKRLVGGGMLKIVQTVGPGRALQALGYPTKEVEAIIAHVDAKDTIEGAPPSQGRAPLPIFDMRIPQARTKEPLDPLHGSHPA